MNALIHVPFFLAFAIPQLASASSAQELLSECRAIANADVSSEGIRMQKTFQTGVCWGTFGTIQTVISHTDDFGRPIYGVCAPPSSRLSQLIAIFVTYAEKNPQRIHEDGFVIAVESLQAAFPCAGRKK